MSELNFMFTSKPAQHDQPAHALGVIVRWLDERTTPTGQNYTQILHADYENYTAKLGIPAIGVRQFGVVLSVAGIARTHTVKGSLLSITFKPHPLKIRQQQLERGRQRARLNRFLKS